MHFLLLRILLFSIRNDIQIIYRLILSYLYREPVHTVKQYVDTSVLTNSNTM